MGLVCWVHFLNARQIMVIAGKIWKKMFIHVLPIIIICRHQHSIILHYLHDKCISTKTQECTPCFPTLPSLVAAGMQNGAATVENGLAVSYKVKYPQHDTHGHLPKRNEHKPTQRRVHKCIAALFIITPNGKQLRSPSTGERTDQAWHIHTVNCSLCSKVSKTTRQ